MLGSDAEGEGTDFRDIPMAFEFDGVGHLRSCLESQDCAQYFKIESPNEHLPELVICTPLRLK